MKTCIVCNTNLILRWTDRNSEARCSNCDFIYTAKHGEQPVPAVKDIFIPWLQRYWSETGRRLGLGAYLVNHPNPQDADALNEWLDVYCDELNNKQ